MAAAAALPLGTLTRELAIARALGQAVKVQQKVLTAEVVGAIWDFATAHAGECPKEGCIRYRAKEHPGLPLSLILQSKEDGVHLIIDASSKKRGCFIFDGRKSRGIRFAHDLTENAVLISSTQKKGEECKVDPRIEGVVTPAVKLVTTYWEKVRVLRTFCESGDALTLLQKRFATKIYLTRQEMSRIFEPVIRSLKILHTLKEPLAHGDVKLANIVLDEKGRGMWIDFEHCSKRSSKRITGSTMQWSPELFEAMGKEPWNPSERALLELDRLAADVWALGTILLQMILLGPTYDIDKGSPSDAPKLMGIRLRETKFPGYTAEQRMRLFAMLSGMLKVDPEERMTMAQAYEAFVAIYAP